jgi:hypothetical protein
MMMMVVVVMMIMMMMMMMMMMTMMMNDGRTVYDPELRESGNYWCWNGNAQQIGFYDPATNTVRYDPIPSLASSTVHRNHIISKVREACSECQSISLKSFLSQGSISN